MNVKDSVKGAIVKADALASSKTGIGKHSLSAGEAVCTLIGLLLIGYAYWKKKPLKWFLLAALLVIVFGEVEW